MIREPVIEGLMVPGMVRRGGHFTASELPLEAVLAEIEEAYVGNYEIDGAGDIFTGST
mgnify:CR=1 FL=1